MNKVFTVARREFKAAVMTRAFLISLTVLPIMMGGSVLIQMLFKDVKNTKDKIFHVIDRTPDGKVFLALELVMKERNDKLIHDPKTGKQKDAKFILKRETPSATTPEAVLQQRFELGEKVRKQEIFGFLDIGGKVLQAPTIDEKYISAYAATLAAQVGEMGKEREKTVAAKLPDEMIIRYYSNNPTYNDFLAISREAINKMIEADRGLSAGIDPMKLMSIVQPVPMANKDLPRRNKITGELEDGKEVNSLISFLVPYAIVMVMFMVIMVGATPLMQGVVEEKMQRISEVLLASAQPFQLMLGKLLGGVSVALLLGSVYILGAFYAAWQYGFMEYLSISVVIWFLVYLALAVLMFGSLFIAVGAACTDIKETQSLLMPVMMIAVFPLFFIVKVIQEPDGAVATALSYIPVATPSIMLARIMIPPGVEAWEPFVGVILVVVAALFCVWVASRIFRVGLLMQGKGASFGEMLKWVVKG
ncbi:MAG: ABC transporter permease [Gemmatales bacterium]